MSGNFPRTGKSEAIRDLVGGSARTAGRRPVLLLSRNDAYGYLSKFVAAEITSTIRQIASEVPLGEEEGMPKACVANWDNLRMVARLSLTNRAGELAPPTLDRS